MGLLACLELTSGYLAAIASNIMASLGGACAQALQGAVPPFELNLSRYVAQTILCLTLILIQRLSMKLERPQVPPMLLAGLFSNIFNLSYYTASAMLPLGTQLVFTSLFQLITSIIFNKVILKKSIQWQKFIFMGLVVVGLVLVLQPPFLFPEPGEDIGPNSRNTTTLKNATYNYRPTYLKLMKYPIGMNNATSQSVVPTMAAAEPNNIAKDAVAYVLCVIAGFSSTARATVYRVALPSVNLSVIGFWVGILGVVPSVAFMFFMEQPVIKLAALQFLILFGHSFGAASYSTFNIYAQQRLSPITWALMDNTKIIFNFALQYTVLANINPGNGNVLELVGAFVALAGIGGVPLFEIYYSRKERSEPKEEVEEEERILETKELVGLPPMKDDNWDIRFSFVI